jgi:hypothetical protein
MGGGMDPLQLLDRDLVVNLGGREFGMAKELLDKADIRAAFRHLCGASVAEQVAGAAFAQFRTIDVVAYELGEPVTVRRAWSGTARRCPIPVPGRSGPHRGNAKVCRLTHALIIGSIEE